VSGQNSRKSPPGRPSASDSGSAMESRSSTPGSHLSPGCGRPDLAVELPRWDELDPPRRAELEQHAERCAGCGPSFDLLVRAERWLGARAVAADVGSAPETRDCPAPEHLYDFGRGPGFSAQPAALRASIQSHVRRCATCRVLVATLQAAPPVPLVVDPVAPELREPEPEPEIAPAAATRPTPILRLPVWGSAAAAAGIVGALFLLRDRASDPVSASDAPFAAPARSALEFPAARTLRGEYDGALLFPRGRVLAGAEGALFRPDLAFELDADDELLAQATAVGIELYRTGGGAFDEGVLVAELEGLAPGERAPLASTGVELAPGHYTWTAWAEVDGLLRPLGELGFEVARDAELLRDWEALAGLDPTERRFRRLALLDERGWRTDARAFVRAEFPPTPERAEYLGRRPEQ